MSKKLKNTLMNDTKPDPDEIYTDLLPKTTEYYTDVREKWKEDERYYELDFKELLQLPQEFAGEGVVLPTARDIVDTFVDHIDISNARVYVNKKGTSKQSDEEKEMMRKFYTGMIYMTNVNSDISPWRVNAKFYALHGLAPFKTVWDADRWFGKPERNIDESENDYAARVDEWRSESHDSLPIVIQALNPYHVMPDPFYGGRMYVFEKYPKVCVDIKDRYPDWSNPKGRKLSGEVEFVSYFTRKYRIEWADGETILKVPVSPHNYGLLPYVFIDSGLGNMSIESKLEMRYVGILRYVKDLLIAESRDFSISDSVLKRSSWPWGTLEGKGALAWAAKNPKIDQQYGTYTAMPDDVKLVNQTPQVPPDALNQHLYRTSDFIAAHAAPRSVRGLGEVGVRSGADRRLVIAEAASRYRYSEDAFKHGTAKVLINCAHIMKNVVPGNARVWAKTPTDEFDMEIEKDKMKEPFTCFVEFAPISEEDEYRRHDDLERLVTSGIATPKWARGKMSDVDPIAMEMDEEREKLRRDPNIQQIFSQYAAGKAAAAISRRAAADQIKSLPKAILQQTQQVEGGMEEAGRRLVPPIPNVAAPGSAEEMQNRMKNQRSQTPMYPGQGIGGGGNRP